MGFLDRLLKSEARRLVSSVVSNAVDDVINNLSNGRDNDTGSTAYQTDTTTVRTTAATPNADEEDCCYDKNIVCARIEDVVATEWSGYTLRTDIQAYEMGAADGARDYTYGLYLDGMPKAMIIVLEDPAHYRKKDTRLAHEACQAKGVFCMNLMLHLPNRRSYIAEQLRKNVAK